jgi:hypothetical protein
MATFVAPPVSSQSSSGALLDRSASGLEHAQTPLVGDCRQRRVGPVMHADKRDSIRGGRGRQYLQELLVAVTGECGDDHGVEAGIGGLTRAHVGMGVDPEDRQVIAVLVDHVRKRRHAH